MWLFGLNLLAGCVGPSHEQHCADAQVLATLNHPHIGAIYGLEDPDGIRALVLELVDGETLSKKWLKVAIGYGNS